MMGAGNRAVFILGRQNLEFQNQNKGLHVTDIRKPRRYTTGF